MPERAMFEVIITLDPMLGPFYTPESAREHLEAILLTRIPHYDPIVLIAPPKE